VLWLLHNKPRREGVLTLTFGLWYGMTRFVTDFLRIDKRFFGLTGSQWTALAVAIISASILIWWALHPRPGPGASSDTESPADASSADETDIAPA
jgi:prolipoprotein diacylglyceryltransferase